MYNYLAPMASKCDNRSEDKRTDEHKYISQLFEIEELYSDVASLIAEFVGENYEYYKFVRKCKAMSLARSCLVDYRYFKSFITMAHINTIRYDIDTITIETPDARITFSYKNASIRKGTNGEIWSHIEWKRNSITFVENPYYNIIIDSHVFIRIALEWDHARGNDILYVSVTLR